MTAADLMWDEASADHARQARQAALARAETEFAGVFPYLASSQSWSEYGHRRELAMPRLASIAQRCGIAVKEVADIADRHMGLYVEAMTRTALPEGTDPVAPLAEVSNGGSGYGSGPAKPDGHNTGPDFSNSYAEVPPGPLSGPDPSVTEPQYLPPAQVQQATGTRREACGACGCGTTGKGKCKGCGKKNSCTCGPGAPCGGTGSKKAASRHTAQDAADPAAQLPAGVNPGTISPDGLGAGGMMTPPPPITSTPSGTGSSLSDPVATQVASVATSVAASNPHLPAAECRRIARRVVGGYLHRADLDSLATSDDPGGDGGQGNGSGGHGMSGVEEYGLGRALVNKLPGGGGGGGAGAMADVADVAEAAAL